MFESVSAGDIAVQGIRAQRVRMNIIANNIANAQSTRTPDGGPFRRQLVILRGEQLGSFIGEDRFGVKVKSVEDDPSPFRTVFDPSHPDANADGIVAYPNINLPTEMIDLLSAQRAYEANVDVLLQGRRMTQKSLEIIQA